MQKRSQRLAVEANGRTSRLSGSTIEWPPASPTVEIKISESKNRYDA